MRNRCHFVQATDVKKATNGAPVCIRLGSLSGVFKAHCEQAGVTVSDQIRETIAQVLRKPDAVAFESSGEGDRIRVNLGQLKSEFIQWCHSHGMSASAALRLLIAQSLELQVRHSERFQASENETNGGERTAVSRAGLAVLGDQEQAHESSRIRLRLKPSELQAISQMAEQRRTSPQRLVTQILRAFLLKTAAFSHQETVDMGAVNLSLMRIGTNLNQITKQLNAQAIGQSRPGDAAYAEFEALNLEIRRCVAQLDGHVRSCAQELALSRERWRIELQD